MHYEGLVKVVRPVLKEMEEFHGVALHPLSLPDEPVPARQKSPSRPRR